jgi:hypothetical protein
MIDTYVFFVKLYIKWLSNLYEHNLYYKEQFQRLNIIDVLIPPKAKLLVIT